jgi:hypothetical protein
VPSTETAKKKASAAALRAFYREEGYLVFETGIRTGTLDRAVEETSSLYEGWRPGDGPVRTQDAWLRSPSVRAIALHAPILGLLRCLYEREPLPFQTLNFPVGTQQPVHSDTVHFNSEPAGFVAGAWIALEDIDEDNGPLVYYPGSHRLPEYTPAKLGIPPGHANYHRMEGFISGLIAKKKLRPKYATLKKGQALIWAGNLLHGGAPQRDPARSRHTQATHYFFEGCKYWTPMNSEGRSRAYRKPQWIS